jgi:hypothetical protein
MDIRNSLLMVVALWCAGTPAMDATNVTTWRYDIGRTGQNTNETLLTPADVNMSSFGKLFSYLVDGYVYAQPLYVSGLNIAGTSHNVIFIATEHDSIYAMDADQNLELWKVSLIDAAHGAPSGSTTVPSADVGTGDLVPEIGITGTPVIDLLTNTIYVVAKSKEPGGVYVQRLHALDLTTGREKANSPVVVQGSVPGNGNGNIGGTVVPFQPLIQLNRPGLLLFGGHVYIAFASHGDNGAFHGWVFAYDGSSLQQTAIYNTSPNGQLSGIWQSGAGLAADSGPGGGRMFFATGNGSSNPSLPYTNTQSYGNAVVRLDMKSNGGLQISDQWTAFDQAILNQGDIDQGSGGVLLLPDQPGSHPHELVQVGKNGRIEVLDRENLGGFNPYFNNIAEEVPGLIGGAWSTPAYWNGNVYFWGSGDRLKQFGLNDGLLSGTPIFTGSVISGFPGSSPVVSSNGTSSGIVWAIRSERDPAILYAFNASNVDTLLYSSDQNSARDSAGKAVKFAVPVVANGKVYVGAQGEVDVYGLLAIAPPTVPTPTFSPAPGTYSSAQSVKISDTLSGAIVHYTTDGTTPTTSSNLYSGNIPVSKTETIQAIGVAPGYNPSGVARGTFTIGTGLTLTFETENLHGVSSGPTLRIFQFSGFPDGTGMMFESTKVGDNVTYTAYVPQAGNYDLHVSSKNWYNRGIFGLSIDGTKVGSTHDEYNPTYMFVDFDLGPIFLKSGGSHTFKFTVTGKNSHSSDYKMTFDYLRLIPQ